VYDRDFAYEAAANREKAIAELHRRAVAAKAQAPTPNRQGVLVARMRENEKWEDFVERAKHDAVPLYMITALMKIYKERFQRSNEEIAALQTRVAALESGAPAKVTKPHVKHRGEWSPTRSYSKGDAVTFQNRMYEMTVARMEYTTFPDAEVSCWQPIGGRHETH
jgi:hypothetical protein